jgi:FKBP-type peptidyl-prolyl cis-trans isomerase
VLSNNSIQFNSLTTTIQYNSLTRTISPMKNPAAFVATTLLVHFSNPAVCFRSPVIAGPIPEIYFKNNRSSTVGNCDSRNKRNGARACYSDFKGDIDAHDVIEKHRLDLGRKTLLTNRRSLISVLMGTSFLPQAAVAATSSSSSGTRKDLPEEYRQGTAALSDMNDSQAPIPRSAYHTLPSGVVYADVRTASGNVVKPGSRVNLQWVLRKSNGYFVDSSQVSGGVPFIFTVGDGTAIAGLNEGVQGMAQGGVRRLLIPPSLAYVDGVDDGRPGPIPVGFGPRQQIRRVQTVRKDVPGEYLYLEVQVTRVR